MMTPIRYHAVPRSSKPEDIAAFLEELQRDLLSVRVAFSELTGALGAGQHGTLADGDHTGTLKPNLLQVGTTAQTGTANRFRFLQAMVRAKKSAAQAFATGVETALTFDGEDFDTDAMHDNVTNNSRFTAPVVGKYRIFGHIEWASNATGLRFVQLTKGGAFYNYVSIVPAASGDSTIQVFESMVELSAGQYMEVYGMQNSGGDLNVLPTNTRVHMIYVGE